MNIWDKLARRLPHPVGSGVIDSLLNGALILCTVLIVVAFVRSGYLRSSASANQTKPRINKVGQPQRRADPVGQKISLQGVDFSKSTQTLLLFLNTQCRYCQKSEPFYRRIRTEVTDHQQLRLIAVFPQSPEKSKKYLDDAGITLDDVRQLVPGDLVVKGTPTLLLVNREGIATKEWVGFLSPPEESDVVLLLGDKRETHRQTN